MISTRPLRNFRTRRRQKLALYVCVLLTCGILHNAAPHFIVSPALSDQAPSRRLTSKQIITEELAGSQQHTYEFLGNPGQLFQFTITPDEYGIRYAIYDATNRALRKGRSRSFGTTFITFAASATDTYRLVIMPSANLTIRIHYELQVRDIRITVPVDETRLKAEQAMEEAERLSGQAGEAPLRQAIKVLEEALARWRVLGNLTEEGHTLLGLGVAHYYLSEGKSALECFNQALLNWHSLNDLAGQAETYYELANTHTDSGDTREAQQEYKQALSLWQSLKWLSRQPQVMTSLAVNQMQQGNLQEAVSLYQQANDLYHKLQNLRGIVMTLNGLGNAYYESGEYRDAADRALAALSLAKQIGSLSQQQIAHSRIGEAHLSLGEIPQGLDHLSQALKLAHQLGDPRREAIALRRLGTAHDLLNQPELALKYYQCALPISQQVKHRFGTVLLLNLMGELYERRADEELALTYYSDALKISQETQNQTGEIASLHHLAHLQRDLGNLPQAHQSIERAFKQIESLRERVANRQLRESYFATVQKSYGLYVDILMRQHDQQSNAKYAERAWQANEQARARILREMLNENRVDVRVGLSTTLLERERVLQEQLNAKANRLLSVANPIEIETLAREVRELRLRLADLEGEMRQAAPGYAALTQPLPPDLREVQQKLLDEGTALLEYALGEERSYVWLITRRGLRAKSLAKRSEIETQARRVYDLLTARLQLATTGNGTGYGERIRQADAQYWQEAAQLSTMILPTEWLTQLPHTSLLVVSDGALQYLPFSALPLPGEANETPLLSRFEVTNLPSITVLAELRRQQVGRQPRAKMLAVLADPVYNANDERLRLTNTKLADKTMAAAQSSPASNELQLRASDGAPISLMRLFNAEAEAEAIRKYATPEQCLMLKGLEVNRSVLDDPQLSDYRILHFATHGYLNSEHPELSGMALSNIQPDGKKVDGLLRMHEIYRLKLPADLIVLSACETALGKEVRGEGLIALTRGFMYAGATRVVASLWKINDATTPQLMDHFYAGMLKEKLSPAAALRMAQLEMLKNDRTRAPFYWAAFILQGEPRNFSSPSVHPTQR